MWIWRTVFQRNKEMLWILQLFFAELKKNKTTTTSLAVFLFYGQLLHQNRHHVHEHVSICKQSSAIGGMVDCVVLQEPSKHTTKKNALASSSRLQLSMLTAVQCVSVPVENTCVDNWVLKCFFYLFFFEVPRTNILTSTLYSHFNFSCPLQFSCISYFFCLTSTTYGACLIHDQDKLLKRRLTVPGCHSGQQNIHDVNIQNLCAFCHWRGSVFVRYCFKYS